MKILKDVREERDRLKEHFITIFRNIYCNDHPRYKELKKEEYEAFKKYKFYCNFLKILNK